MKTAIIFLAIIFLINLPSLYYGLYQMYWWFDIVLHFGGGFFVAMFMSEYLRGRLEAGAKLKNLIIITGATVLIGVLWEFAEYVANQTLIEPTYRYFGIRGYFMGDLNDTIVDLLMDILGSGSFAILHLIRRRKD